MTPVAQRILDVLTPELGPHTAGQALRVACDKVAATPESLSGTHLDNVCEQLGKMCRTLLGRGRSEELIAKIRAVV